MPFVWSLQEALMTAELGSTFPEASGGVAWVEEAFGPGAAWLCGKIMVMLMLLMMMTRRRTRKCCCLLISLLVPCSLFFLSISFLYYSQSHRMAWVACWCD